MVTANVDINYVSALTVNSGMFVEVITPSNEKVSIKVTN